jgi:hypothetical protein
VRQASALDEAWLPEARLRTSSEVAFDEKLERVVSVVRHRYGDLVLEEKSATPPLRDASVLLADRAAGRPSEH